MRQTARCLSFLFTAALLAGPVAPAFAQSTAFTYQGSLDDAGAPASGLHDFRFRLFSVASGGTPIGSTLCVDNVSVVEGVFTVQLDFGQQFATTEQRHLEVEVRRDTGLTCGSVTGFVVMVPRQQITVTPVAIHANSAFSLDAADGSPANAVFVDNSGKVGIGTTAPSATLHVRGTNDVIQIDGSATGSPNMSWMDFGDVNGTELGFVGDASSLDSDVYVGAYVGDVHLYTGVGTVLTAKSGGSVGIGTTTPAAKLDVRGDVKMGPTGELFASGGGENLRIIRGSVSQEGLRLEGTGFTVTRTETGMYSITFTSAFSNAPTIAATPLGGPVDLGMVSITGSGAVILTWLGGNRSNWPFHFIAIGPR